MDCNILGHREHDVGVEVIDEQGHVHTVEVRWDGEVEHYVDDYPHKREERTEEEQRIMSQVEVRAKYAAQQEFPEEDILDPMWDIHHLEAGLEALSRYPLDRFHEEFRDYYDALVNPGAYITDADFDLNNVEVYKVFRFRESELLDVAPVFLQYYDDAGEPHPVGTFPDYPEDEQIVCVIPPLEVPDDYEYEAQFHDLVVSHVMAQIRDLYFHMGEMPPEEYQIEGIGKLNIHGDGIGET